MSANYTNHDFLTVFPLPSMTNYVIFSHLLGSSILLESLIPTLNPLMCNLKIPIPIMPFRKPKKGYLWKKTGLLSCFCAY